jgi:Holliday junction resolvase RusA-like endonuclease
MVRIEGRFPGLNEYTNANRTNFHNGNSMKTWYSLKAKSVFQKYQPLTQELPIYLAFVWHEPNKKRDVDNIGFAAKFILDGMVLAGFIPDDSPKYVKGMAHRAVYDADHSAYVEVLIIPAAKGGCND